VAPVVPRTASPPPPADDDEGSWGDEDGAPHWLKRAAKEVGMLPPSSAHPLSLSARRAAHVAARACRAALARWREHAYGGADWVGWRGEWGGGEGGGGTLGGGGRDASLQPPTPPRARRRPRLPPCVATARATSWLLGANARRRCAAALLRWLAEAAARREDVARAHLSAIIARRARLNAAVTAWCSAHAACVAFEASLERRRLRRAVGRWGRAAAAARRAACVAACEVSWRVGKELRWRDERRAQLLRGFGAWFAAWRLGAAARAVCGRRSLRRGWRAWTALLRARDAAAELDERAAAAHRHRAWQRLVARARCAALLAASLARLNPAFFARLRAVRRWHGATVARAAARDARRARYSLEARRYEELSAGGHAVRLAVRRWAQRTLGYCLRLEAWAAEARCEVMRCAMHRWRVSTAGPRRIHCRAGVRDLLWA